MDEKEKEKYILEFIYRILTDNRIKINKLIQAVKQIDKRVKKLED